MRRLGLKVLANNQYRSLSTTWSSILLAPPDKILGLNEEFLKNTSTNKVNLGVGAYRNEEGKPYVLKSVKDARMRLESKNLDHEYAGIAGHAGFLKQSLTFAYGENAEVLKLGRVAAVQSLSGTGYTCSYTHVRIFLLV
jgi:aspartate aminotransferase